MLKNKSVVNAIADPQFINLDEMDVSTGMSRCEIKVLYVGANRNGSFITKEVATEMAKTLRGAPIVGVRHRVNDEGDEDFRGHGEVMTIDDDGFHFTCETRPYGFVSPNEDVWFQTFTDTDEFGNEVEHEYLMTRGYLWTKLYPETKEAIEEGKPQSMQLDAETMEGEFKVNPADGEEYYIINDAEFLNLCILGDDVEPCFEGASIVGVPDSYSMEQGFTYTLAAMLKEFKDAKPATEFAKADEAAPAAAAEAAPTASDADAAEAAPATEFTIKTADAVASDAVLITEAKDEKPVAVNYQARCSELEGTVNDLTERMRAMESELAELRQYRLDAERAEKQAVIDRYYMLDDADKADVIKNIDSYTKAEIDEKLALVYVRRNVSFEQPASSPQNEAGVTTFSLDDAVRAEAVSPIVEALRSVKRNR